MPTTLYTIPAQQVRAGVEKDSPPVTLPAGVSSVTVQLADQGGSWGRTSGNVKQWGVQRSADGGATWAWGPVWQGDQNDPATWLPFGTLSPGGQLPALRIGSDQVAGRNDMLRLAVVTDADIALGAVITTA